MPNVVLSIIQIALWVLSKYVLVDLCFSRKSSEEDEKNDVLISPQWCKTIGRLIDGYLAEVASDRNLSHTVFTVTRIHTCCTERSASAAKVVQILFHEQVRATAAIKEAARANRAQEQDWEIKMPLRSKSLRTPSQMRFGDGDVNEVSSGGSMRLLPSSSRRFLNRFWVEGIGQWHRESKSTGTSGCSQSKFSSSSSRKQRYSIS
ncbi:putative NPH3 domain-containing protein [Helianthus anomalus]